LGDLNSKLRHLSAKNVQPSIQFLNLHTDSVFLIQIQNRNRTIKQFRTEKLENNLKQKVMKTNIRTIIGIFALGLAGTLNGYSNSGNSTTDLAGRPGEEKKAKIGLTAAEETATVSTGKTAIYGSELKSETADTANFFLSTESNSTTDYEKEAQLATKAVVDREEAKIVQKLIEEGKLPVNQ
jgi:hypothetical protein